MKQVLTITLKRQQNGRGEECDGERADGAAASPESKPLMGEEEDRLWGAGGWGGGGEGKKACTNQARQQEKGEEQREQPEEVVAWDGVPTILPAAPL